MLDIFNMQAVHHMVFPPPNSQSRIFLIAPKIVLTQEKQQQKQPLEPSENIMIRDYIHNWWKYVVNNCIL